MYNAAFAEDPLSHSYGLTFCALPVDISHVRGCQVEILKSLLRSKVKVTCRHNITTSAHSNAYPYGVISISD